MHSFSHHFLRRLPFTPFTRSPNVGVAAEKVTIETVIALIDTQPAIIAIPNKRAITAKIVPTISARLNSPLMLLTVSVNVEVDFPEVVVLVRVVDDLPNDAESNRSCPMSGMMFPLKKERISGAGSHVSGDIRMHLNDADLGRFSR